MQYVCKCDESKNLKARKAHQSQCLKWSARGGGGGGAELAMDDRVAGGHEGVGPGRRYIKY